MAAKRAKAVHAQPQSAPQKDVDYTVRGLIAIVATVLLTALFFAQPNVAERASQAAGTIGGKATATASTPTDSLAPTSCQPGSLCDGSKLIRQQADCTRFEAFCENGCEYRANGATCI